MLNPFDFPLTTAFLVNVIVTFAVDSQRPGFDLTLNSNTWTHLANFPFWITSIVILSCYVCSAIYNSSYISFCLSRLFTPRQRNTYTELYDIPAPPQRATPSTSPGHVTRRTPHLVQSGFNDV